MDCALFQAYLITCSATGKRYVGITSRMLKQRWAEHVYDSRSNRQRTALGRAIAKHGADAFTIEPLCCARTWEDICHAERLLIEQWRTKAPRGYNLSDGGAGAFGVKKSADSVERSAAKHRGRPCHPNTRAASVAAHKGVGKTSQNRERIAVANRGKPRSEETKAKLRAYWAKRRMAGDFKTSEPYGHSSKSNARKAAAARIAKIPLPLACHIARCYLPKAGGADRG